MAKLLGHVRRKMLREGLPPVLDDLDEDGTLRSGSTLRPKSLDDASRPGAGTLTAQPQAAGRLACQALTVAGGRYQQTGAVRISRPAELQHRSGATRTGQPFRQDTGQPRAWILRAPASSAVRHSGPPRP